MSALCRGPGGPCVPTSAGAAQGASAAVAQGASAAVAQGASAGAAHAASGGADDAASGGAVGAGPGTAGNGDSGSGGATGTSLPTRTCDHNTDGPRNGGAASGGRGAVYGSGVHVDWTSSGRCAEGRGSGCRCGIGGAGAVSGRRGAVKACHVGCTSGGRCGGRCSGCRCGSGGGSPSPPENVSCGRAWVGRTCLAGAIEGSGPTGGVEAGGVQARGVQTVGVAAGGAVGIGG